jgi:hypothetical protein
MGHSTVMLSAAKHLAAQRDRPFAEFTLSGANVLRVTVGGRFHHSSYFLKLHHRPSVNVPSSILKVKVHCPWQIRYIGENHCNSY